MNNTQPTSYRLRDDPIIRFCAFYAFLYLSSLIIGGIGVYLIVLGLSFFSTRVLARTSFGQTYIRRLFGLRQPEQIANQPHSAIYKVVTASIKLILLGLYIAASAFLIWTGIKLLFNGGFLDQNLIYLVFFKFK